MRFLITAGPTREPLDAVRFISNRSSGKMGLALAAAAGRAGHDVTLLLGPGVPPPPEGFAEGATGERLPVAGQLPGGVYRFESSAELKQLLEAHFRDCDVLLMAAAVADYRPAEVFDGKLPRRAGEELTLRLQATPDLVALMATIKRPGQKIVAFALEQKDQLETRAAEKLRRKGVDAIVANPLGTMDSDRVAAVFLTADGGREVPSLAPGYEAMTKADFAAWLVRRVESLVRSV